jgi:hypothetical protein
VAEPSSHAGGGEFAWFGGSFPGATEVLGEGPGEAELGVGGDDQPGPQVGGVGIPDLGDGPAEGLLEQPERVLQVESSQERLPAQVYVLAGHRGA